MKAAARALACLTAAGLAGCEEGALTPQTDLAEQHSRQILGGDRAIGRAILDAGQHGCHGCHVIPEIAKAKGKVGPPLTDMRARAFIAGSWPNQPSILVAFIRNAPGLVPETGMPPLALSEAEARHVAAYLYAPGPN